MAYYGSEIRVKKSITPTIIGSLTNETASTTISTAITGGDSSIEVTSSLGMAVGNILYIVHPTEFYLDQFRILSIATNTIGVDMPSGNSYDVGTTIVSGNDDFSVDGSVTPVKFNFKTGIESIPARALISRILITMETATTAIISDFGDIAGGLDNGIYLRKTSLTGPTNTLFNAKTNRELANIGYDLDTFPAGFGNDGIKFRLTFTRMGSYIPLDAGEDLELWVQDPLQTITNAVATIEGVIE